MLVSGRRLLVISKHLLNSRDAQAQQSRAVVDGLIRAGAHLEVICAAFDGDEEPVPDGWYAIAARNLPFGTGLADKVARKVRRNANDTRWLSMWSRSAARKLKELISTGSYDCIVSLGLPMESHIPVLVARPRLPWLAYFSDPWPESLLPPPMSDFALPGLTWLQRRTVREVLLQATALGFSCREQQQFMARFYPELTRREWHELPHVAPVRAKQVRNASGKFRIVHSGSIGRERVCDPLCEALAEFAKTSAVEIHFAGALHPRMATSLQEHDLSSHIVMHGWLSKRAASQLCCEADVLLLLEASMPDYPFLPSKLADYAATGRPILALTGAQSPAARLIAEYGAGVACRHDRDAILDGLRLLHQNRALTEHDLYREFAEDEVVRKYGRAIFAAISSYQA